MEEQFAQEIWNIKKELYLIKGQLAALEAVYGQSQEIPHKAMEIAFGWDELKGAEK